MYRITYKFNGIFNFYFIFFTVCTNKTPDTGVSLKGPAFSCNRVCESTEVVIWI